MTLPTRLVKLKAMSAREIAHRVGYGAYTAVERLMLPREDPSGIVRLRAALIPEIRNRLDWQHALLTRSTAGRFFAWQDDPAAIRQLFRSDYQAELDHARHIAGKVARHEIEFFGETFRFGTEIPWHADPVTGAEWPRRYHRDVPVNSGNAGYGDVKYVWELNRHQFLMDLAKAAFLDGSRLHADALFALVRSWQAEVPYATGAPWACALEPAFRAWSWMWAYELVRSADLLPDDLHLQWLGGFYDHGRYLHRHLEEYTSPYNHLIGEASALFALGVLFPEFAESGAWRQRGRGILESTVSAQFYPDGGSVEQSTFYHHATLGFYMLAALLAERNGGPLSPAIIQSIERGVDFSAALTQPDGRVPSIGGADDGKPIRLEHLPFWDFRPYHAIGAVMFARPDFKAVAGRFFEDALWLLGTDGRRAFLRLPSEAPRTARAFPASGYYVARSGWSRDADYVCFDCGEQAAGLRRDGVPSAAHGHADCLSVIATLGGRPVLVDPGFHCYNGQTDWEVHFRKTGAHNTVAIDGTDQATHVAKMAWTHAFEPTIDAISSDSDNSWARASHDGYVRQGKSVVHRRTVWLRPGGYFVIHDELTGRPGHIARANYQFAPGSLVLEAPDIALFDGQFELAWTCSARVSASVIDSGPLPSDGWIAPSLGKRERAPRLLLEFEMPVARVVLLTVLADRHRSGGTKRSRRVFFPAAGRTGMDGLMSARIEGHGWQDHLLATEGGRIVESAGLQTDALLAVVRFSGSCVREVRHIGGTEATHQDLVCGEFIG